MLLLFNPCTHSVEEEEENVICDDTFYQNESDDEMTDEDIPEGHEPILATRSLMWPKGRNSPRVLRVSFMDTVPASPKWRVEGDKNENFITTDYILKVANEWNRCDPTVVPVFENVDQISQSDIRICFKGRHYVCTVYMIFMQLYHRLGRLYM